MEALIVVVAELAAVFVTMALVVALLVAAGALAGLLSATAGRRPTRTGLRRLRQLLIAAFAIASLLLLALQTVALRPLMNWGLGRLAESHGYEVSIADAELSLLRGGLEVRELRIRKGEAIAVTVQRIDLDLEWPSLMGDRLQLQHLEIEGVLGRFAPPSSPSDPTKAGATRSRRFIADSLTVRDLDLVIASDATPVGHHLRVDRLVIAPLRSDHLIYDLILSSEGQLRLDELTIRAERAERAERAGHPDGDLHWRVDGIPSAMIRHRLGPAFAGLRSGTLDLDLGAPRTRSGEPSDETTLTLAVILHGTRVDPPADSSARQRLAAGALNLALRARDPLEIELRLPIRAQDFQDALSLADAGLESAVTRSLIDAVIRSARVRTSST